MQIRLFAMLLALAAATPAPAGTRNFGVNGFDRIRVDGPYKVKLATGVAPFAKASGPQAALDRVKVEVQGRTLIVRTDQSAWGGYPGKDIGQAEIAIGTHELNAAWVNGAGSLEIDKIKGLSFDLSVQGSGAISVGRADVDQLKVTVAGTGSAVLGGRSGKMTASVRGLSSLDATALATKDAAIGAEGTSTIKANVTNSVKVDGSGPATIALTGRPACTTRLNGAATVSGCR